MRTGAIKLRLRLRNDKSRAGYHARRGFTMLELQVAVILLAFGMVTMASLLATQQRTLKRLRGDFLPGTTLYITRSNDPWQQKMYVPARVTNTELTQGVVPTPPNVLQTVQVIDVAYGLTDQRITVTAETTPVP